MWGGDPNHAGSGPHARSCSPWRFRTYILREGLENACPGLQTSDRPRQRLLRMAPSRGRRPTSRCARRPRRWSSSVGPPPSPAPRRFPAVLSTERSGVVAPATADLAAPRFPVASSTGAFESAPGPDRGTRHFPVVSSDGSAGWRRRPTDAAGLRSPG